MARSRIVLLAVMAASALAGCKDFNGVVTRRQSIGSCNGQEIEARLIDLIEGERSPAFGTIETWLD